ncbi:cytochrome P450 [Streptomyces sp. NPDC093097]|uniref:cytochrome P450 n=1 Tax=Streptomyces sp. NPDC093097 TaxID=3366027 RepID=UPI0037F3263D
MTTTTALPIPAGLRRVDLSDPETFVREDMDAVWRTLRDEAPVYWHPETPAGCGFWVLSRYDDVLALLKDDERFSSGAGNMLDSLHKPNGDPAGGKILALTDNPRHVALRTILLKAFTPRIREFIVNRLKVRVDELIDSRLGIGSFDFAREVAEQIPMGTICDLLGFPPADRPRLLDLSREALSSDESGQTEDDAWEARNELLLMCMDLMEARRADPQDDLVSAMVTCEVGGRMLTDDEVIVNLYGFILAGDHTSRLAMGGAVTEFAARPEQWRALKESRVSMDKAVEEVVRWTTPVMHVGRTAKTDMEWGGHTIQAGDLVTAWNISANRDERHFDAPDVFDLARNPNKHLAFGFGPHFCFGAYLGRAEVAAVLDTLVKKVSSIELVSEPRPLYSTFLRGYSSIPVALHGATETSRP